MVSPDDLQKRVGRKVIPAEIIEDVVGMNPTSKDEMKQTEPTMKWVNPHR